MPCLEVRALVNRLVRDDRERAEHDRGHAERAHRELVPRQPRGFGLCLRGGLQREDACPGFVRVVRFCVRRREERRGGDKPYVNTEMARLWRMGWKKKRPSDFGLLERTMTHVEIRKTYACVLSCERPSPSRFSLGGRALTPTDICPHPPKKTRSVRHSAAKSPAGERTL